MRNMKKFLGIVCLSLLLTLAVISVSLGATDANAYTNTSAVMSAENLSKKATLVIKEEYAGGLNSEHNQWMLYEYDLRTFDEYDYIEISVSVNSTVELSDGNISTYQYGTQDRYFAVDFRATANAINIENTSISNTNNGKVTIVMSVYADNDLVQKNEYRISVHITPYGSFTTPYDMKSARWFYNEWLYNEGITTSDEYTQRDNELSRATAEGTGMMIMPMSSNLYANPTDVVTRYTATISGNTVNFLGRVTFTDTNGVEHPARQIQVQIMRQNDLIGSTIANLQTNANGEFSASGIDSSFNIYFRTSASTLDGFDVNPSMGSTYSFTNTPRVFTGTTSGFVRETGTDCADAFYVHQAIIVGHAYSSAMGYSNTPNVTFPRSSSQYDPVTDTIWLVSGDYCDFDVILHEYGHYIMDKLNFENHPGGSLGHGWDTISTDVREHKREGIEFAWGEGWATYFAIASQLHQNVAAFNIPNAGDTIYHDTIDQENADDLMTGAGHGEGNQGAVARTLLQLVHTGNSTPPILTHQSIWDICDNSKAKSLSDFMVQVYANTPKSQISAIGTVLQSQNITPTLENVSNDILNYNTPTLNWTVDTSNVSVTYLDSFTVVFMDTSFNTKYEVNCSTNISVNISSYINTIASVLPGELYWGIKVNQYESSANTGPYYSALQKLDGIMKYTYFLSTDSYELSSTTRVQGNITIPSTYNGQSVTAIGNSAFANQSMNEIIIPSSVTSIGYNAFGGCNNLESITIPFVGETLNGTSNTYFRYIFGDNDPPTSLNTVVITGGTGIGAGAFSNCQSLESIIISNTVTTLGDGAFAHCTGISTFFIPSSVTSIANNAFYDCTALASISVSSSNTNYSSQGGILYNKAASAITSILHVPHAISGNVTLHSDITSIPAYAFENRSQLTGITSPNILSSIGNNAFFGCSSLGNISIINGVESIGLYTFWGCTGLTDITIPSSVTSIGASAFVLCSGLLSVTIPSSVTSIGGYAFANCTLLETVNVLRPSSSGITTLGQNVFAECPGLTEICVPNVAYKTAANWSTYSSIIFADTGTSGLTYSLMSNGKYSVSKGTATANSVLVPDRYLGVKVTKISDNGFSNYSNMTGITISTIITSIGSYAFSNCGALNSITIPSNVTSIESHAFYNCTGLSSVTISSGITSIANNSFANCSALTNISIPISVTSIGESAFSSCSALTNFTIPISISSVGNSAFYNCANLKIVTVIRPLALGLIALGGNAAFGGTTDLYAIYVPDAESQTAYRTATSWSTYNSVIFADNGTPGLAYTLINGNTAYSVTRGTATSNNIIILPTFNDLPVTAIGNNGFYNRPTITSITIPNTVEIIGSSAFYSCTGITNLVIPSSVTSIGQNAFRYCSALTNLTIMSGVTSIGNYAFANSGVTNVTIPNSVTSISSYTFNDCSSLINLTIPNSVISIGSYAFNNCNNLTSLTIPNSVTSIDEYALKDCIRLASITLSNNISSISNYLFYNCNALTSIAIPVGVINIGISAFSLCSELINVTIPNGVTNIGNAAFNNCSKLTSISLPSTLNTIGHGAFNNCTSLTSITIPSGVTSIATNLFYNCSKMTSVTIPSSVTSIGNYAFYNCIKLNNVTIPINVTSIGDNSFRGCTALTAITIPKNVTSVGTFAFQNCNANLSITWNYNPAMTAANFSGFLKVVNFQGYITSISANAFSGCIKLLNINLPATLNSIGSNAFWGCTGLTKILICTGVTTIGSNAFQNCSNLYIYTYEESKPSGWSSNWNSSNRPVYWFLMPYLHTIMDGFGYNGSTYYWNGEICMSTSSGSTGCYCNTNNGNFLITGNTTLTFSVITASKRNAWSTINGSLNFVLKNSSNTIIKIGGNNAHASSVTVSKLGNVTINNGSFSVNTENLPNGTYTLTLSSSFTRASWSGSSTHTFIFVVDK